MKVRIRERHSKWVRWSHWLNVPLLMIMIWSGLLIYWANPQYIPFPQWLAKPLRMDYRLAEGMGWHFAVMWLFTLNGIGYVAYLLVSREWGKIKLSWVQRIAYAGALTLGFFTVLTGIAILKPVQASFLTELLGGYPAARFQHFLCMGGLVLFTLVHLIQVARAGWKTLRAMIAGYEVVEDSKAKRGES